MIAHHLSFYFFAKQGVGVTAEVKNGSGFLDLTFGHLIFAEKMAKIRVEKSYEFENVEVSVSYWHNYFPLSKTPNSIL